MPDNRAVTIRLRCPRCGSRDLWVTENYCAMITWEVTAGRYTPADGAKEFGDILGLSASCRCGHHWRPRAAQIAEIAPDHVAPPHPPAPTI